jgi:Ribosome-binding factor A
MREKPRRLLTPQSRRHLSRKESSNQNLAVFAAPGGRHDPAHRGEKMLEVAIKSTRLGFVTVHDVRVTPDLRDASVFYTVYSDAEEQGSYHAAAVCA